MGLASKAVRAIPAVPVAAGAVVLGQVMRAAHRPDLPSFPNQDPSASLGDPDSPPVRVVALGDSSVTAPGVDDLDSVWIRRLCRGLSDHYRVELVSLAVGGAKARDVVEGQLDAAVRLRPTVATVSVGANDALRGVRPRAYRRHLTTIVECLASTGAGVMVWGVGDLSSIPRLPATLRPFVSARSHRFDAIARDVALSNPRAVKVHTQGWASAAFFGAPSLFAADLFHANDEGHSVFADEARPAFEAAMALGLANRA